MRCGAFIVLGLAGCMDSGPCSPGFDVGQCPPDLVLPDRTEHPVALSELRRDVVLLELSALW